MKHEKQFDGITRPEALAEVLKECNTMLIQDFTFDDDTQIATWDERAAPVMDFETGEESEESFNYNDAMEQCKASQIELQRRTDEVNAYEKLLLEVALRNENENDLLDKRHKEIQQSIKELEKLKTGTWKRVKSFFHNQT